MYDSIEVLTQPLILIRLEELYRTLSNQTLTIPNYPQNTINVSSKYAKQFLKIFSIRYFFTEFSNFSSSHSRMQHLFAGVQRCASFLQ
ncbi:hypothetical protein PRIO_5077 [Paenibacillus riograndensis SBR5]|uniref:Uncharacterized protein n=1 Tax=Paenibacillus riograndensis SBR5 TaxID=1073571 RepID=A0A0E4HCT4_9BACL|nr:hypothetical protein PRIO_5077 [Paenibacillus riograndensis SBR5]